MGSSWDALSPGCYAVLKKSTAMKAEMTWGILLWLHSGKEKACLPRPSMSVETHLHWHGANIDMKAKSCPLLAFSLASTPVGGKLACPTFTLTLDTYRYESRTMLVADILARLSSSREKARLPDQSISVETHLARG